MLYVSCSDFVRHFIVDIHTFVDAYPDYGLYRYHAILETNHIEWGMESMWAADVSLLDGKCVMALLAGTVRAEIL